MSSATPRICQHKIPELGGQLGAEPSCQLSSGHSERQKDDSLYGLQARLQLRGLGVTLRDSLLWDPGADLVVTTGPSVPVA